MLLRMVRNIAFSDNKTLAAALAALSGLLPSQWRVQGRLAVIDCGADALVDVTAPDGRSATLSVEVKTRLDPKDVIRTLSRLATGCATPVVPVIASSYLGDRTRQRLREAGAGYIDFTGNVLLRLDDPAVYIERSGADRDPWRVDRPVRSLKGGTAARIVRVLVDFVPPLGVRQIAELAEADPGYVSRVVSMLGREDLVRRTGRGPVETIDWAALLRRWTEDYSLLDSNRVTQYLDPRGIDAFVARVRGATGVEYALTGSLVARTVAPVAPTRMAVCFVEDAADAGDVWGLVPAEAGANVLLVEPFDPLVYLRSRDIEGLRYVGLSQAGADLLTGPGRNPAEGEALLEWMRANESEWRVRP